MSTVRWQPDRARPRPTWPVPPLFTAMGRGVHGRCPGCGNANLFNGFLKVVPTCRACGAPLGLARADDAPPYVVIVISGHIIIPLLLMVQKLADPSTWVMAAIFIPFTIVLALGLLRPAKGGVVGMMLAYDMLKPDPTS